MNTQMPPQKPQSFMSSMKEAASKTSSNAMGFMKKAVDSARVSMSLPAIKKFREDLEKEMSNKQEWEKRPVQDRQAVFNEIKSISKLLHKEGVRANMARNLGWKGNGGKKSSKKSSKKSVKKSKTLKKR